jgi:hypothetical protein
VVVICARDPEDEKLLVDKKYFAELVRRMHSLAETIEIMADQKLFAKILGAASTLRQDAKRGKLYSFEKVLNESTDE